MNFVILQGYSALPDDLDDLDPGEKSLILDADHVIGIEGQRAVVLKSNGLLPNLPVPLIDGRTREDQYRQDGQRVKVKVGAIPGDDDVRLESGIPLRGVTGVSIEDRAGIPRIVHLRLADFDLDFGSA